jgi:hypothetical protein
MPGDEMKRHSIFLLLFIIIITACGDEPDDGPELVGQSSDPTVSNDVAANEADGDIETPLGNLPSPRNQELHLPATEALPGRLLYLQGNTDNPSNRIGPGGRLFLAAFDGSDPLQLAERISEASVMVSHDRSMVGYAAVDGFSWYLYIMDLDDQQPLQIYDLPNRFGFIEGWSPDMNWVLARANNTLIIASVDGTIQYEFPNAYIVWLEDSRALVADVDNFFNDSEQNLNALFIFNPVNDARVPLDLGISTISTDMFPGTTIQAMLQEQNTDLVATSTGGPSVFGFPLLLLDSETQLVIDSPAQVNATLHPCETWRIKEASFARDEEPAMIYESETTLSLNDFAPLGANTIVFTRWHMEDCDTQVESLRSEILKIDPDGEVQVLVDDVYPGISTSFMRATTGKRYAISPDRRFLAVITGSFTGMRSAITLVDLETGERVNVMKWQSSDANSFLIWEAFTAIFWVN